MTKFFVLSTLNLFLIAFISCYSDLNSKKQKSNNSILSGKYVECIFQDSKNNYWFGTNGSGLIRYDGKKYTAFTRDSGLADNQVLSIQEDPVGNIWLSTGGFGVSRLDEKSFTTYTKGSILPDNKGWSMVPDDLWFLAGGGAYQYHENEFRYLPLPNKESDPNYTSASSNRLSAYGVYSILKSKNGDIWFGTQTKGVCHYDGKSFHWLSEQGLAGPAVRALYEDKNGNFWFGNNGQGLFQYDVKSKALINFTEEKGLSNPEFLKSGKSGPGTLARVWTIMEDDHGNLWVGTYDAGVWRYDGQNLINFTTINGLSSNAINCIYKDKKGVLWIGTEGFGVCKFNGKSFDRF